MLRSGRALLLFLILFAVAVACRKDGPVQKNSRELESFLKKKDFGLVGLGEYLFKYSDEKCQWSINEQRGTIRMQDDMQSVYVHIHFESHPVPYGGSVPVLLKYKVGTEEVTATTTMKKVETDMGVVWWWDEEKDMGVILPSLF